MSDNLVADAVDLLALYAEVGGLTPDQADGARATILANIDGRQSLLEMVQADAKRESARLNRCLKEKEKSK